MWQLGSNRGRLTRIRSTRPIYPASSALLAAQARLGGFAPCRSGLDGGAPDLASLLRVGLRHHRRWFGAAAPQSVTGGISFSFFTPGTKPTFSGSKGFGAMPRRQEMGSGS
jgi:hypothetical protein